MKNFLKPAVIGFLMFLILGVTIVSLYTSSQLLPIFGEWKIEKNGTIEAARFPIYEKLTADDYLILRNTFEMEPLFDRITFTIYPHIRNADVYINGEYVFKLDGFEKMEENTPPYIFLNYRVPQRFLGKPMTLEIKVFGPQDVFVGYLPMKANSRIIRTASIRAEALESYVYIFAMGMQVILVFLMISIFFSTKGKNRAYFYMGLGIFIQIFYLLHAVISFNSDITSVSNRLAFLLPIILISSFTFIYQGIELFLTQKLTYTKHLAKIIPLIFFCYAVMPINHHIMEHISAAYFILITGLMIYITTKGKDLLLTCSIYLILFTTLYDFYFRGMIRIFPMPPLQTYSIITLNFIFGSFFVYNFIASYKHERKLRLELSDSYEEIHASNEELEASYQEIEQLNDSLEKKVRERTEALNLTVKDLRMILNNTDEGFLTLDKLQKAENTFSRECTRIFGFAPAGVKLSKLLFPCETDGEQASFVDKIINAIYTETNELRRESYLSLLPEQLTINGLFVELEYKWIEDAIPGEKQLMIILRDMTAKRKLENMIEHERNNLSKIVKIMLNLEEFMRIDCDYREFMTVDVFKNMEQNNSFLNKISYVKRRVHTFKGNLASFGLLTIAEKLHLLEDDLSDLMLTEEGSDNEKVAQMKSLFTERNTVEWLTEEEENIKQAISTDIFREERFYRVYPEQLEILNKRLCAILPETLIETVKQEVKIIEHRSLKELINYYRFVVENLCEKLGKTVQPLIIRGNNTYVDANKFDKWIASLIHLFRNSIDHGIESADERIMSGKSEYGQLIVDIRKNGSQLKIEISDDGRGIDVKKIANIIVEKGIKTEEDLQQMTDEQILNFIFVDGFSTKKETTLISGRGVGLSSVRHEWEELGGTLQLISKKGEGTTFIFTIED